MARARFSFRLHRTVIVLICVALLVALMQGATYFSLSHQMARSAQVEELADTLIRQVTGELAPLMAGRDDNSAPIKGVLERLTRNSRILDASVYNMDGSLVARAGENISVRDRLAIGNQRAGSFFNHQLVRTIEDDKGPSGFVRLTLDTHVLEIEAKQVDNTTNLLRLMMLLALAIGIILARTLLQNRRSRWQQSPYLLTASTPLAERREEEEDAAPSTDDTQPPSKDARPPIRPEQSPRAPRATLSPRQRTPAPPTRLRRR